MTLRGSFLTLCLIGSALRVAAQAAPAPPDPSPDAIAGIPVNYDEAKVGAYSLPDPLKLNNGKVVRDARTWYSKRRPEIMEIFETQQYGRAPGRPADESFDVVDAGTPALNGKALRKQITISFSKDKTGPSIDLLVYLPAAATKPVPMFFSINFGPLQYAVKDPGIKPETAWDPKTNLRVMPSVDRGFGNIDAEALLDAGYGVATYYYGDIDPDYPEGFPNGIRARYLKPGQKDRSPDDWGSIAAWAWGMSRVEDYFETDKSIDARRVVIHGVSRLGKTVMWAGAHDQRFAAVIASCSGEGGAALSHRNYGETIAHLTAPSRYPYQFAINYAKYAGFPDKAPMDANLLIALIAPRPLLLQTGNTDYWSDPKGDSWLRSLLVPCISSSVSRIWGQMSGLPRGSLSFMTSPITCTTAAAAWCLRIGASTSTSSRRRFHRSGDGKPPAPRHWLSASWPKPMLCQDGSDALSRGFIAHSDSAKPRTQWLWTNGNVSEAGITEYLDWMKRSGIGGFQLVDVAAWRFTRNEGEMMASAALNTG